MKILNFFYWYIWYFTFFLDYFGIDNIHVLFQYRILFEGEKFTS